MQSKVFKAKNNLDLSKPGFQWRNYIVYIAFVVIFIFFGITLQDYGFHTSNNLMNIVRSTTMITIMAAAMTFVMASGEIDLSVGSTAAFAALISALTMDAGFGVIGAFAAGVVAGVLIGAINGFLVTKVAIPSFLVTLGMMQLVRGVSMWMTDTKPVIIRNKTFISIFGSGNLGPIPSLLIWSVVILIIGHIVLKRMPFGRKILATGGNRLSAEYSGINTGRIKFTALLISGAAAGISGMLYSGMMQSARYSFGQGDELNAIAAVIIGGTSLFGGTGSIIGTVIGSLMIGTINNGLIIMGLQVSQQMIVSGAIIILAVAFGKKMR
ncbi:ABC transporter permease [Paenibacillus validus]|uniref:ABC transporter permease n=1 Tax=Paenibacillus validus TaxID=44253 RepID=UPI000FD998EF|nr:ABC transporter permease [Paenibacillus validus]MED4599806.1 ABC transporter permease [Paenibacillus validus]MED4604664.1 ABC transporter permease [Paenibacillus validus]